MSKVFVSKGEPLTFYLSIKARNKESELKKLIETNGGKTKTKIGSNTIVVADDAKDIPDSDVEVYSTALIFDSVKRKKLMPLKDYQIRHVDEMEAEVEEEEEEEDDLATQNNVKTPKQSPAKQIQTPPTSPTKSPAKSPAKSVAGSTKPSPAKSPNKRKDYTPDEDTILLDWAKKHPTKSGNGVALWNLAEKNKITAHSSQSMRGRYLLLQKKAAQDAELDAEDKELADTLQKMAQEPDEESEKPKKQQAQKKGGKKRKIQEEEEASEQQSEEPPKKKRRFSMPYISLAVRKAKIFQFFEDLIAETKVSPILGIHALIVYSGNVNLARQYLLNKGDVSKCEVKAWTPQEDDILLRKANMIEIQAERGREVTLERVDFLDFLSPDYLWVR